jgi:HlyD family secretion protein
MSDKEPKAPRIFRQQALERLSSPERLDQLMPVVSPRDWLRLGGLAIFGILAVLWSIFGSIPITVTGKGVLTNPRQLVQLQSPISGQLRSLKIKDGQCIKKNDILGIIEPSAQKQQLQQQRSKLAQLTSQIQENTLLRQQKTQLERETILAETASLKQRLEDTQRLHPLLKDEGLSHISQQEQSLKQRLKDIEELIPLLKRRVERQRELQEQGAISEEQVLRAETEDRQNRQDLLAVKAQLQQLQLQKTELEQKHLENINAITQLRAELKKLDTRSKQLEQNNLEATNKENNQVQELQQAIDRLENEVVEKSMIKSSQGGCIMEITATIGQYLQSGNRLGTLRTEDKTEDMMSVAYFKVKDGKQIRPGMKILITPDTVKRAKFGGIVGKITRISEFPITSEAATSMVGNPEVVQQLMDREGGKIEAIAQLQLDSKTHSGYKWSSSQGPQLKISQGTTTTVQVTVEEYSPITFILPILREWSGIGL